MGCACTKGENVNLECNIILHTTVIPNLDRPLSVQIEFNRESADVHDADVFSRTKDDDLPGHSRDDQVFLSMMQKEICVTSGGNLQLPLPIKDGTLGTFLIISLLFIGGQISILNS